MGDDMLDFTFETIDDYLEIVFNAPRSAHDVHPDDVRKALEAAIRSIPDSSLRGVSSFRLTVDPKMRESWLRKIEHLLK